MKFDKLFFRHEDAVALGSSDMAVILEFVRWSCHFKESETEPNLKYFIDGVFWMQDSHEAWRNRMPWLSERTIRRYLDELCERGFLAKKISGSVYGGRNPNFYRVLEVDGQIDRRRLVDKLTTLDGQIDQGLVDKLDTTSLSKTQTKIQTINQTPPKAANPKPPRPLKEKTWPEDDPLSSVFTNLTKLDICKVKFETAEYREWLIALMEETAVTIPELNRLSKEWQEHHNEKTKKPQSPKSSFRTWVNNHCKWRSQNDNSRRKVESISSQSKDDPDYIDFATLGQAPVGGARKVEAANRCSGDGKME